MIINKIEYKLPKSFKKKWIAALRSGKFSQTKNALQNVDGYCCLGVACRIQHPKMKLKSGLIDCGFKRLRDVNVPKILKGTSDDNPLVSKLSKMNDNGRSFKYIASYIEKYL